MSKLKPLNLQQDEITSLRVAIKLLLENEKYHIDNSTVGKIGKAHFNHIDNKLAKIEYTEKEIR